MFRVCCIAIFAWLSAGVPRGWAGTLAQFRTPLGDIQVELFDQDKSVTTENFIRYVTSGRYRDMFIHRWEPGFVIQGGGFLTTNRYTTNADIDRLPKFGEITNEYSVGKTYSNTYGTIAMARVGGLTNSATSEWFLNLTNNAFLDSVDGGFTVFGRVLQGTNVLERFNNVTESNGVYRINIGGALNHLPVLSTNATYEDLVYVDITLLDVKVTMNINQQKAISWNSVFGRTNHVEFTTVFPPAWQLLINTNGTGNNLTVTDASPDAASRFYRVRVD